MLIILIPSHSWWNLRKLYLHMFADEKDTGGRLNKKDRLTGYGDSHVKDKTS